MRPERYHADDLVRLLRRRTIATIGELDTVVHADCKPPSRMPAHGERDAPRTRPLFFREPLLRAYAAHADVQVLAGASGDCLELLGVTVPTASPDPPDWRKVLEPWLEIYSELAPTAWRPWACSPRRSRNASAACRACLSGSST